MVGILREAEADVAVASLIQKSQIGRPTIYFQDAYIGKFAMPGSLTSSPKYAPSTGNDDTATTRNGRTGASERYHP
jgi:hypothetical protein